MKKSTTLAAYRLPVSTSPESTTMIPKGLCGDPYLLARESAAASTNGIGVEVHQNFYHLAMHLARQEMPGKSDMAHTSYHELR